MSIFTESFKPNVKTQLEKRQAAMLQRSPIDIRYLNSRNAWIRMSSGVNIWNNDAIENPTFDQLSDSGNYDNTLAKKYILFGGVLNEDGSPKAGVGNWNNAYSRTSAEGDPYRLGLRPQPGITNIEVKSRGAYGSLRDVTVNFQCWDIRQLEDLELLYMRPGYTILLEWGWAPYLNNEGNIETNVKFYDIINQIKPKEQIWEDLKAKSEVDGNYEAMFGQVKNYSWSARPDGGYDCQTTVISIGEVVESLKVNYTPVTVLENIGKNGYLVPNIKGEVDVVVVNQESEAFGPGEDLDIFGYKTDFSKIGDEELKQQYSKNILAGMFWELWRISYAQFAKSEIVDIFFSTTSDKGRLIPLTDTKTNATFEVFHKTINIKGMSKNPILENDEQLYITLETLCYLLNNYVLLQEKNGTNSTETKPYAMLSVREDNDYKKITNSGKESTTNAGSGSLLCTAHPLQISVDPSICLIRNDLWSNGIKFNIEYTDETDPNTGEAVIKFPSNINNPSSFVEQLISICFPTDGIGDRLSVLKFITDTVGGGYDETNKKYGYNSVQIENNVKEITRIFNEFFESNYKIKSPDDTLIFNYNLNYDPTSDFGKKVNKTLKEARPTNLRGKKVSFYDLLYNRFLGNFSDNDITTALGGQDNVQISKGDPVVVEQEKIQKTEEDLQEVSEKAQSELEFLTKLLPYFKDNDYHTELGIIGNIYINIQHLYDLALNTDLAAQDRKEKNDINVYDFMKNLLKEISSSIGNVSTLEVYVEPNASVAKIIDVAFTGEKNIYDTAFVLEVQGLKTTARSYKLESKIFQEQSTMVAIGAQAGGGALSTDTTTLVDFNKKIIDRIITQKVSPTDSLSQTSSEILVTLTESLKILYKYFSRLTFTLIFEDANFDISEADTYKNALKDLINAFKTYVNSPGNNRAIIPTSFSVDLDGIGGIIIGNIFRIPKDALPKGYKGGKGPGAKLGYVVTGLGHSVQNGDWITKIDAQTIILDEMSTGVKRFPDEFDYDEITIVVNPSSANSRSANNNARLRPTSDQAVVVKKYGEIGDENNITTLTLPYPMYYDGKLIKDVQVHKLAKDSLEKILKEILSTYGLAKIKSLKLDQFSGLYNVRGKRTNGDVPSIHSWGIAIDIYAAENGLDTPTGKALFSKPEYKQFIDIWYKYGWKSFGRELGKDWMHFQVNDAPF